MNDEKKSDRERAYDHLRSLTERAGSTSEDWGLSIESPLEVEVRDRYVFVLFSTGGPHTEILAEYDDAESAEYWFENEPCGGTFEFHDWGVREVIGVSKSDMSAIMSAIMRDPDDLTDDDADDDDADDDGEA